MKYRTLAIAGMIAGALLPFTASALTMEDIQSQIATLLEQITQLQAQILTLNNAASTSGVPADVSTTESVSYSESLSCMTLGSEISPGSRGDTVLQMQKFLVSQGYLSGDSTTGFYGPLTVAAVQMMQKARGVVSQGSPDTTGFGSVGPKTRAAIACKSEAGGSCKYITQAQPSTACAAGWQKSLDSNGCQQGWYCPTVEATPIQNSCTFLPPPTTGCDGGSWTANLDYKSCVSGWSCKSITINTNACPFIAPIYCANGTAQSTGYDAKGCIVGYKCSGETTPIQTLSCPMYSILACNSGYHRGPSTTSANGCTIPGTCVRDGVLEAPVVTGVDGPASLNVGQTGTWTVRASVPNTPGAQIRYSVVWGDEAPYAALQSMYAQPTNIPTSSTFTHVYSNSATYYPKFTVSNDAGSAQTSSTVSVGIISVPTMCPMVLRAACPVGQHYEYGNTTYDSKNCPVQDAKCVPDSSSGSPSISVTGPNAGAQYSVGNQIHISWNSQSAPSGSVVQLDLLNSQGVRVGDGVTCSASSVTGSCDWTIPYPGQYSYCPRQTDRPGVCVDDLPSSDTYFIRARLQSDYECRGFCPYRQYDVYASADSGTFVIVGGTKGIKQ